MQDDQNLMFLLFTSAKLLLIENLRKEYWQASIEKPLIIEKQIKALRDSLHIKNMENIKNGGYMYMNGNYFSDFVLRTEKIGDLICNSDSFSVYKNDYNHNNCNKINR